MYISGKYKMFFFLLLISWGAIFNYNPDNADFESYEDKKILLEDSLEKIVISATPLVTPVISNELRIQEEMLAKEKPISTSNNDLLSNSKSESKDTKSQSKATSSTQLPSITPSIKLSENTSTKFFQPIISNQEVVAKISYKITNLWLSGATIQLDITNNTSKDIDGWELEWNFKNDEFVTNLWNANYKQIGNKVNVKNFDWNRFIKSKNTLSFGFNLSFAKQNSIPQAFLLNKMPCSIN